jgi:hypothetical protein
VFYLSGGDGIIKHRRYTKATKVWSAEEILKGDDGKSISGVNTSFGVTAIFDGTAIRIFYVKATGSPSLNRIKVRTYPNGNWSKVTNEVCTGVRVDSGDSIGAVWQADASKAWVGYRAAGTSNFDLAWSNTYANGTWHVGYTLPSGHNCTKGYALGAILPHRVEAFCTASNGIKHGYIDSYPAGGS